MEQSSQTKIVSFVVVIALVVIGVALLMKGDWINKTAQKPGTQNTSRTPENVVVENTKPVNGKVSLPVAFPASIPMEAGTIIESATTKFLDHNAQQLSVSYRSSKSVAQKYAEYKSYMLKESYSITEGSNSSLKSLFATRKDSNLSVVISSTGGQTLVQLSYLLK